MFPCKFLKFEDKIWGLIQIVVRRNVCNDGHSYFKWNVSLKWIF